MPEQPLVSVITAFYNSGPFLHEAIASVLAQTYANWEYWLVNDGSTDSSPETARAIAEARPDRIFLLQHPGGANHGVCTSRNLALKHARGKYIAILDADDVWFPNKLEEQIALASQHPEVGLLFGPSEYWCSWNAQSESRDHIPQLAPGERVYAPGELLPASYPLGPFGAPCPTSVLVDRELLCTVGGFEECLNRNHYEDQGFLAKLYLSAHVYVSSGCLDRYRIHQDSTCAVAATTGAEECARREYMDWLHDYLVAQHVTDTKIWAAWRRATFRYRHPALFRLRVMGSRLRRAVRITGK
jgi:glycosyltransferase involved in cell wall biosynthesis